MVHGITHLPTNSKQMFEQVLLIGQHICYHIIKEFRTSVFAVGRVHMKNDISKDFVIEMMKKVDASDKKFLLQVYTIIKRHLDKKGRR